MTKDVYAGDDALDVTPGLDLDRSLIELTIEADADPDVILRVASTLNALNSMPMEFHATRTVEGAAHFRVILQGCADSKGEMLVRKLRQLVAVHWVKRTPQL
jgi:hypothetical protein